MLTLRLARGARPSAQSRRLLLAAATAGAGFLLLCSLGYALAHPGRPGVALWRLSWCAVPLAATVALAVEVARADPGARPATDPGRVPGAAAVSTAVAALLGAMVALLVFLHLRGDLTGLPLDGRAAGALAADRPLPLAGTLTLLAAVPLSCTVAAALATRPDALRAHRGPGRTRALREGPPRPAGLPWGTGLVAVGIALGGFAGPPGPGGDGLLLPGALGAATAGTLLSWAVTLTGLAVTAPGVTAWCGWLLTAGHPGVRRLLAGRRLRAEASRLGPPVGALCTVTAALLAAVAVAGPGLFGPLSALGTAVVLACAAGTLAIAAAETRTAWRQPDATLRRLGAAPSLLRGAAALRGAALLAAWAPLTAATAAVLLLPLP